jgi:mono/diheme cytochrome c family protein
MSGYNAILIFSGDSYARRRKGYLWPALLIAAMVPLRALVAAQRVPTFNRDVAPVLFRRCAVCHHPGEVAPFSLLKYEDARSRARQIAGAVESRRMPPWQPEPGFGDFSNDRRLSDSEIRIIAAWAGAGAPEGAAKDLPPAPQFVDGWQLGKPDLTLTMPRPIEVKARESETYRCFVLPVNSHKDLYVRALELRPGTSGVVHHAIVVLDPHRAGRRLEKEPGEGYACDGGFGFAMPGMLAMWTAGTVAHADPDGVAAVLRKNSDIVIQLHLRPGNQDRQVQASLGLYLAKSPPRRTPVDLAVTSYDVDIPAGRRDHIVNAFSYVPADADVFSIFAHAHFLAKSFKVRATLPDGEQKDLLLIRHWNFDWQENYWYAKPLRLPAGTRLDIEVVYDNSAENPRNPNSPPKRVTWGFLATDEMCEVHLRGVYLDAAIQPPPEHMH